MLYTACAGFRSLPPLRCDLSILFDRASYDAYQRVHARLGFDESNNVGFLPPFSEEFIHPTLPEKPYKIGICLSFLPKMLNLKTLLLELSQRDDISAIHLRRHPRCQQDWTATAELPKVTLRKQGEGAQRFFKDIDIAIAPNSGVIIEALHYGCPTFYEAALDELPADYYRFAANGIVPIFAAETIDSIEFFDHEWLKRFSAYDQTIHASLPALQKEVSDLFMRLVRDET